jgi:hypothetical protein
MVPAEAGMGVNGIGVNHADVLGVKAFLDASSPPLLPGLDLSGEPPTGAARGR